MLALISTRLLSQHLSLSLGANVGWLLDLRLVGESCDHVVGFFLSKGHTLVQALETLAPTTLVSGRFILGRLKVGVLKGFGKSGLKLHNICIGKDEGAESDLHVFVHRISLKVPV